MFDKLKKSHDIAKQIEREWFLGQNSKFIDKSEKYHRLRKYARGEHNVDKSISIIVPKENGSAQESYTNYDLNPIQILPKFKDRIVNDALPQLYKVTAEAVDEYHTDLKNEERNRLLKRLVSAGLDKDMQDLFDIDVSPAGSEDRPTSVEEVDLRMNMDYKPNVEIAVEAIVNYTFELNDYEEIMFDLLSDAVDIGRICTMTTLHPNKGIVIERVDASDAVWSYSKKRNHDDGWYYGIRKRVTISELQTMTNSVLDMSNSTVPVKKGWDEALVKEIKGSSQNYGKTNYNEQDSWSTNTLDDTERLDLLYYTYKDVVTQYFKKKTYASGATKITPFKGDYNGEETQGFTVFADKREVWIEGYLILGTDYTFGAKYVDNLAYKETMGINKVYSPVRMYAISLYEGNAKGIIERCETIIDKMQTTEIKIQQMVAAVKPSGIRIDVSKIENIETTGGAMDFKTVMKIYNETGNEIYASGDGDPNDFSQGNIHELRNGVVQGLMDLVAIQNNYLTQLRDAIGLPQGTDASNPHPDTAVKVQEEVVRSSNVTLRHILDAVLKITAYNADNIFSRIKDVFKYYPHIRDSYEKSVGKINSDVVDSLKDLGKHDLGIFCSLKPSVQDRSQLEANINAALLKQDITLDDAQQARYIGETSTKMANQYLRIRRERREQKLTSRENEKIELQGQQQQKLAQVQAQAKNEALQITLTIDQSRIQSEAEAKIAILREEHTLSLDKIAKEFEYDSQLEQIKAGAHVNKTIFQEDQKNKRQDNNNTEKSEMIDQKATGGPPKDFIKE